jgi:pilus assembly protein Flp/PilA
MLRSKSALQLRRDYMSAVGLPERSHMSPLRGTKGFAMKNLISAFLRSESGATAIEYALIAAGISIAIITVVGTLGSKLNTIFTNITTKLG